MQTNKFDEAIDIYNRFLRKYPDNHVYIDKLAYACLKKKNFEYAMELYKKSLSIENKNIPVIKNLAYIYSIAVSTDSAILLLSKGIMIDSTDMDLYLRRATLYYVKNYTKRALDDYLVILASGDTSKLYLKRIGIGYCNNLQPNLAISYLLGSYKMDSSDYETCNYLGQSYYKLKDMKNSIYYYDKGIKILTPFLSQLVYTYRLCAESQKSDGLYQDAIANYLKMQNLRPDPSLDMTLANIYDEKLNDKKKAIYYYEKFLSYFDESKMKFSSQYIDAVKQRLEFLKKNLSPE